MSTEILPKKPLRLNLTASKRIGMIEEYQSLLIAQPQPQDGLLASLVQYTLEDHQCIHLVVSPPLTAQTASGTAPKSTRQPVASHQFPRGGESCAFFPPRNLNVFCKRGMVGFSCTNRAPGGYPWHSTAALHECFTSYRCPFVAATSATKTHSPLRLEREPHF